MKKLAKTPIKLMAKAIEKAAGAQGWPPDCLGMSYQPKRPAVLKKEHKN